MRDPFPLQWPEGWKRTVPALRTRSRFYLGFADALRTMRAELERIGAANVVITSNLPVRRDGLPYADGPRRGTDPGIAVWFQLGGQERVWACDRWLSTAENLRAIALSIEALRGLDRWGAGDVVTRAFAGFNALPPGPGPGPTSNPAPDWRQVFGADLADAYARRQLDADATLRSIRQRYREAMRTAHPDQGGHHDRAVALNQALQLAERELAAVPA